MTSTTEKIDWWKSVIEPKHHARFEKNIRYAERRVSQAIAQNRARESTVDALLCLRDSGISFEECMKLAKRIGNKLLPVKE